MLLFVDMGRFEKWRRDAVETDVILLGQGAQALQFVDRGVEMSRGCFRIAADALHSIAREVRHVLFISRRALAAQFHPGWWSLSRTRRFYEDPPEGAARA